MAKIDFRRFAARDDNGNRHIIVAERSVLPASDGTFQFGKWQKFPLEDGRRVRLDTWFFIVPDGIRLTPEDPTVLAN